MRPMDSRLFSLALWLLLSAVLVLTSGIAHPTPPDYASLGRDQRVSVNFAERDLLRIWVVYVGQGDGLLIQLPTRYNYDPDPGDNDDERTERLDILIDGGSMRSSNADNMADFLTSLYSDDVVTIEYAIITHHDQDHVFGLERVLESTNIAVETIFHNGLASFLHGKRGFPNSGRPTNAVYKWNSGQSRISRGMAFLIGDGVGLNRRQVIDTIDEVEQAYENDELQGVYQHLVEDVVTKNAPDVVNEFHRVHADSSFIGDLEERVDLAGLTFDVLWPLDRLRRYGSGERAWGETINGNSVTFRLSYGDFQMLFTGDHNEHSEEALLEHLEDEGTTSLLNCDVLKIPHHGSSHALESFFRHEDLGPVVSVASQGEHGARSKEVFGRGAWQHPSTEVIRWLGGAHRVYLTQMHERRFRWEDLDSQADHRRQYELTHILIETDGEWFRVAEIPVGESLVPPAVSAISRSNGTRWVRTR